MSEELENEELYVEHKEFGEGLVLSIDEETDVAEIQFEHGIESIDINTLLDEETDEEDEVEAGEFEVEEELEEGRGKIGQARQASKEQDEDEFGYEKRGSKSAKGRFNYARQKKQSQYDESANLLGLALERKPVDFATTLNNLLQTRVQEKIESLKQDMAQSIYNSSYDGNEQNA